MFDGGSALRAKAKCPSDFVLQIRRQGGVELNPPLCDTHRCGLPLDIAVSPCGPVFALPPRTFGTSRNAMAWGCNADPGTLEDFDAFKGRVRNAVAWLNGNATKKEEMTGSFFRRTWAPPRQRRWYCN